MAVDALEEYLQISAAFGMVPSHTTAPLLRDSYQESENIRKYYGSILSGCNGRGSCLVANEGLC
jgi:hypothetical protein